MAAGEGRLLFGKTPAVPANLKLPPLFKELMAAEAQKFFLEDEKAEKLAKLMVDGASPELMAVLNEAAVIDTIKGVLKSRDNLS